MTRLMVKVESPDISKDSFAAEAKRMYRAGSQLPRPSVESPSANRRPSSFVISPPDKVTDPSQGVGSESFNPSEIQNVADPGVAVDARSTFFCE